MAINFGNKSVENIQFGNTPIKSVYYGSTKVRPSESKIVIESDLTNSTLASLQTQGWTNIGSRDNTGYRLNSSGLMPAAATNRAVLLYKTLSNEQINNLKKVEFECTTNITVGSWSGELGGTIYLTTNPWVNNPTNFAFGLCASANTNSGYQTHGIIYYDDWLSATEKQLSNGDYDIKGWIDFITGESSFELYKGGELVVSNQYTFNATQLNKIKNAKNVGFINNHGSSGYNNALKYVKLTITLSS